MEKTKTENEIYKKRGDKREELTHRSPNEEGPLRMGAASEGNGPRGVGLEGFMEAVEGREDG